MTPKFSVIVPVYNVEREYLEAALNSVLAQTFSDWECICVDDGSTNNSGKVLDVFAGKDSRFKVFHQSNQGVSAARNLALTKASGEWLFFLDGDDLLTKDALSTIRQLAGKNPTATLIRYGFSKFTDVERWKHPQREQSLEFAIDLSHVIPASCYETSILQFAVKRTIAKDAKFPPLTIGEDRMFLYQCIRKCQAMAGTDYQLYGYRQRASSATHSAVSATSLWCAFYYAVGALKTFSDDSRNLEFYKIPSLVCYITHDYVSFIVHKIPFHDQTELWKLWFDNLPYLSTNDKFNATLRKIFNLCNVTQSKTLSYLLCGVFLSLAWRLHLPFAKAMNPALR